MPEVVTGPPYHPDVAVDPPPADAGSGRAVPHAGVAVEPVGYGVDARRRLAGRLAALRTGPLDPATVVVPTNWAAVSIRRSLAVHHRTVGVSWLTLQRLAEVLAGARLARAGLRPVPAPVVAAATRRAIAAHPGRFAEVAAHPAVERAVVRAHTELRDLDEPTLDELAARGGAVADLVVIHRTVRDLLAGAGWHDERDLLDAAAEAVADAPPPLGPVVVHLPERVTRAQGRLVAALADHVPVVLQPPVCGIPEVDELSRTVVERCGGRWPSHATGSAGARTVDRLTLVSDPDDEVRHAVRWVAARISAGVPVGRIAVVWSRHDPYARLVHDHLSLAGIPTCGTAPRRLDESVAARTLLRLMELPERRFGRGEILGLLAGAPLRDPVGGGPVPVAAWDRIARQSGVTEGAETWRAHLTAHAGRLRARARSVGDPVVAEALGTAAERTDRLAAFIGDLTGRLAAAARFDGPRPWRRAVAWCREVLSAYLGDDLAGWPAAERAAAGRLDDLLGRLASLDTVDAGPVDLATLRRTLTAELDAQLDRHGTFGSGVLVGHLSVAAGVDLDAIVICGATEGDLPARTVEDPLLPPEVRDAAGGELRSPGAAVAEQRRWLEAALASAPEHLVLAPRGELRRTRARFPSRWLTEAAARRAGRPVPAARVAAHGPDGWTEVPSFLAGLGAGPPAHPQEHRLVAALVGRFSGADGRLDPDLIDDPVWRAGLELIAGRRSDRLTRYDGWVPAAGVGEVDGISPTSLEQWAACPQAWFQRHLLGVERIEPPEAAWVISPVDLGSLVHEILEELGRLRVAGPVTGGPGALRRQARRVAARCLTRAEGTMAVGRGHMWTMTRRRIVEGVEALLDAEDDLRGAPGGPVATETQVAVTVPVGGPGGLRILGRVDRVDRTVDGRLVVIDYKTGTVPSQSELDRDPLAGGTRLQLVAYGLGAADALGHGGPVTAAYWQVPVTSGRSPRSVGYEIDAARRSEFASVVATIWAQMTAGLFVARPDPARSWRHGPGCPACDPDGLGTGAARRRFERKAADPRLAAYLALAEPDLAAAVERDR